MQPPKTPAPIKELGKPLNTPAQIFRLRYRADGTQVAAGCSDGLVHRWNLSGKEPVELPALTGHNGWVTGLAFVGDSLLTCDSWGRLTAWDANARQLWTVETAHDGWARAVAPSPDNTTVATCGRDGFVNLWKVKDGKKLAASAHTADTLTVIFAPDGKSLLAGDLFGIVRELPVAGGEAIRTFEAKELHRADRVQDVGGVRCLLFTADGKTLLVAGAEPKTGGFVQCTPLVIAFDRASGKRTTVWRNGTEKDGYVTDLAWHPEGFVVGTSSGQPGQGKLFFWKPGEEQASFSVAKPNCHSVAIAPDGQTLVLAMTNANSSGNGRPKGEYQANYSPIQFWQFTK